MKFKSNETYISSFMTGDITGPTLDVREAKLQSFQATWADSATSEVTDIICVDDATGVPEESTVTALRSVTGLAEVSEISCGAGNASLDGTGFTIYGAEFFYDVDTSSVAGTGTVIAILSTDTPNEVATKTAAVVLNGTADTNIVTSTNAVIGDVTDIADGGTNAPTGFVFKVVVDGSSGADLDGTGFTVYGDEFFYDVDASGVGGTGTVILILSTDTADSIATKTAAIVDNGTALLNVVTIVNAVVGNVTDIADGGTNAATNFGFAVTVQGTSGADLDGTGFILADALATTVEIFYNVDASGTAATGGATSSALVAILSNDTAATIAAATQVVIDGLAAFTATVDGATVTATLTAAAAVPDVADNGTAFTLTVVAQGAVTDTPIGNLIVEISNDGITWVQLSTDAVTATGNIMSMVGDVSWGFARMNYDFTSDNGFLTVVSGLKNEDIR